MTMAAENDSLELLSARALHWLTDNRDTAKIDYVPELIRMSGVDRAKLPDLGISLPHQAGHPNGRVRHAEPHAQES